MRVRTGGRRRTTLSASSTACGCVTAATGAPFTGKPPRSSVRLRRFLGDGELHGLGLSGEDLVVGVHQFDPYLVWARRHPGQVDRIDIARVRPPPGQVIHMDVQMPRPWRYVEGALAEY